MSKNHKKQLRIWENQRAIRLERLTRKVSISSDVLMKSAKIRWIGRCYLKIENCVGLLHYSNDNINILTKEGSLLVRGKNLEIKCFSDVELCIEGQIQGIEYME